jgi:hypothetical protein
MTRSVYLKVGFFVSNIAFRVVRICPEGSSYAKGADKMSNPAKSEPCIYLSRFGSNPARPASGPRQRGLLKYDGIRLQLALSISPSTQHETGWDLDRDVIYTLLHVIHDQLLINYSELKYQIPLQYCTVKASCSVTRHAGLSAELRGIICHAWPGPWNNGA